MIARDLSRAASALRPLSPKWWPTLLPPHAAPSPHLYRLRLLTRQLREKCFFWWRDPPPAAECTQGLPFSHRPHGVSARRRGMPEHVTMFRGHDRPVPRFVRKGTTVMAPQRWHMNLPSQSLSFFGRTKTVYTNVPIFSEWTSNQVSRNQPEPALEGGRIRG